MTPNKLHSTFLGVSISWHVLYSERTRSNATLQSEPLKQKHDKKQSWVEKEISPLPPYPFPLSQMSQPPCSQEFLHISTPQLHSQSVIKECHCSTVDLGLSDNSPQLATASNSYSTTKVYLDSASLSTLVSGLHRSVRKRKVAIYCKVKPQKKETK